MTKKQDPNKLHNKISNLDVMIEKKDESIRTLEMTIKKLESKNEEMKQRFLEYRQSIKKRLNGESLGNLGP